MTTITISKEDYLKAIAKAEAEGQTVIFATLDVFYPRSIMRSTGAMTDRHSELLYGRKHAMQVPPERRTLG